MNFYITGLPRSRTAWMSNFFTTDRTFCYHEGVNGCDSIKSYKDRLNMFQYSHVGDSNTYYPYINLGQNAPIIVILRDIKEVQRSLEVLFGKMDYTPILEETRSKLLKLDALFVQFNDVNNRLEEIWNHCIKDIKFDHKRANELSKMKVETIDFNFNLETINHFKGVLPCL